MACLNAHSAISRNINRLKMYITLIQRSAEQGKSFTGLLLGVFEE